MNSRLSADEWSRYWEKGSLTTFVGGFANNYDGEIRAFWHEHLGALPSQAKIIDLATGNGALAILASEYGLEQGKSFAITAIDFAAIDPAKRAHAGQKEEVLGSIEFRSNTAIENTGLTADSYECAVSQFGFEYSMVEQAVAEVSRILKPSAHLHLMMHHEDSDVLKQARDGLTQANLCLSSGLHSVLAELMTHLDALRRSGKKSSQQAEQLRSAVNAITESLHNEIDGRKDPEQLVFFLKHSMAVFGKRFAGQALVTKLKMLQQVEQECRGYAQRMQDLTSAGLGGEQIAVLKERLRTEGFHISRSEPFQFRGSKFGYVLSAVRNAT